MSGSGHSHDRPFTDTRPFPSPHSWCRRLTSCRDPPFSPLGSGRPPSPLPSPRPLAATSGPAVVLRGPRVGGHPSGWQLAAAPSRPRAAGPGRLRYHSLGPAGHARDFPLGASPLPLTRACGSPRTSAPARATSSLGWHWPGRGVCHSTLRYHSLGPAGVSAPQPQPAPPSHSGGTGRAKDFATGPTRATTSLGWHRSCCGLRPGPPLRHPISQARAVALQGLPVAFSPSSPP